MIGAAAAGRSKVLISFGQVSLELLVVLGELGDLLPELALALLRDASTNRGDTSAADAAAARAAGVRAKLTGNIADRPQRPPHVDGPDFSISP